MSYIFLLFIFSVFLSWFFSSYFPVFLFNSLFLAYIIQEINPIFSIILIIVPVILFFYFNSFSKKKKSHLVEKVQKINFKNKNYLKKEKIKNKEKDFKEKEFYNNELEEIIKEISDKIEKDKKISFDELAKIWLSQMNSSENEDNKNLNDKKSFDINKNEKAEVNKEINFDKNQNSLENQKIENKNISNQIEHNEKIFSNIFVNKIYNEFIKDKFYFEDFEKLAYCLLNILNESGNDPSVSSEDEEDKKNYESYYDILKEVTLAEHTYNTVFEAFELVKKEYKDTWKLSWDILCIVAIAHDLGKGTQLKNNIIFYGSHKDISYDILKNCYKELLEKNMISIPEEKINRLGGIISYHHGTPPDTFSEDKTLKLLKTADSYARKKELEKKLGTIKTWKDIDIIELGKKIYNIIKEKAFENDSINKVYFIVDDKKGLIFIHKDFVFLGALREYIKENNIFWQEFNSKNELEFLNTMKNFFKIKIEPLQWIPTTNLFGKIKGFFYFIPIEKNGKPIGSKPFIPIILPVFCKTIDISQEEIISIYKESPLSIYNIIYQK